MKHLFAAFLLLLGAARVVDGDTVVVGATRVRLTTPPR